MIPELMPTDLCVAAARDGERRCLVAWCYTLGEQSTPMLAALREIVGPDVAGWLMDNGPERGAEVWNRAAARLNGSVE